MNHEHKFTDMKLIESAGVKRVECVLEESDTPNAFIKCFNYVGEALVEISKTYNDKQKAIDATEKFSCLSANGLASMRFHYAKTIFLEKVEKEEE